VRSARVPEPAACARVLWVMMEKPPRESDSVEQGHFRIEISPEEFGSPEEATDAVLEQLSDHYGISKPKLVSHMAMTYLSVHNWKTDGHKCIVFEGHDFEGAMINSSSPRPVFWLSAADLQVHIYEDDIDEFVAAVKKGSESEMS
jgi:hypothetical protein